MRSDFYVDRLIAEWDLEKHSAKLQGCLRRVLRELAVESQLVLSKEPKLQVEVLPGGGHSVWAYFPVHRRRHVVRALEIQLKPTARVLLLISETRVREVSESQFTDYLRDHLGHVLLYLRSPRARNECEDATREWKERKAQNG